MPVGLAFAMRTPIAFPSRRTEGKSMLRRLLPLTALIMGLLAPPGWAADDVTPSAAAAVEPPPASQAASPLQTGPAAQPGRDADFSREFADRLAVTGSNLSAADREDRAALAEFYAGRQQEPLWVGAAGLTAGGRGRRRRDPPCRRLGPRGIGIPAAGPDGRGRPAAIACRAGRCRDRAEPRHPEVRAPCPRRPRRSCDLEQESSTASCRSSPRLR